MSRTIQFVATDPEPGSNYTPAYREFFARLRRARIDKGLSLFEVAELVGLQLTLAYEFENLIVPLPFEWLEVWCKVVGVPFADYLVVYWDSQEAYFQKQEKEREAQETETARERGDTQNAPAQTAPCVTNTDAPETDARETAPETEAPDAPADPCLNGGFGLLAPLHAAFERTAGFFRALFSTP